MIEFATLLIGLLAGVREIELVVQEPVTAVEIVLDGRSVARLDSTPWKADVDFGEDLEPHRLVANGFDKNGNLIDSTYQLINYNRPSFDATILLEPLETGEAQTGRVVWRGALNDPPISIELEFDSRPLAADSNGRFLLPLHDPDEIHVLEAVVYFDRQHLAAATLTFGGIYGDQLTSALTAVPLKSPTDQPWSADQIRGWIVTEGQSTEIFKVAAGPGLLVVVRGVHIDSIRRGAQSSLNPAYPTASPHQLSYDISAISPLPLKGHEGTFRLTDLGKVIPQEGLRPVLLRYRPLVPRRGADGRYLQKRGQKLWDALAVAGTRASSSGRPRAAVLMLDSDKRDQSDLDPLDAIEYLERVHVPLFIWGRDRQAFEMYAVAENLARVYVGSTAIDRLCIDIATEIASQTIVWLQGEFIPSELSLSSAAPPEADFVQ